MNKLITLLLSIASVMMLNSCRHTSEPEEDTHTQRTVLLYAIASNNLSSDLLYDEQEMLDAAKKIKNLGKGVRFLIYSVASKSATEATLKELIPTPNGNVDFKTLKSYDRETFSTDPARMREVISDASELAGADKYGLILWSHGTGWLPDFSDHKTESPQKRSFGMDKYGTQTDYCDILELEEAIPDRMFDYIWFDLCYMMGIEVCYQLRDKCDWIAGYPTEDWSTGMNYDSTLPMLLAPDPDLIGAAKSFFDHYNDRGMAATVTLARTSGLDELAEAAAAVYSAGRRPSSSIGMQNYSRLKGNGQQLYDFGQYTDRYLDGMDSTESELLKERFDEALRNVVVYGACTAKDFNNQPNFNPDNYSGFSCHFAGTSGLMEEAYYRELAWSEATNP